MNLNAIRFVSSASFLTASNNPDVYYPFIFSPRHLIVGGGGGAAKTGVKNGFEVLELGHDGTKTTAESVARHETKGYAVMNMAVGMYDREDRTNMLAVGHDENCQARRWRILYESP